MNTLQDFKHFVGCDVSKNTLDFALFEPGKDYRLFQHIQVSNDIDGFRQMRSWLRGLKVKISEVAFAMEHTGVYSNAFSEWCHKKKYTFVILHPLDVKNACSRGRNKTDKVDAQFIADYVHLMRERLEPSTPESPITKKLRQLYNERALAVKTRTMFMAQSKTVEDRGSLKRVEKIIDMLSAQIKAIESEIKAVISSDEKVKKTYVLLTSIPGIGLVNAVKTIIATDNFTRFQTARQYAKFACVSPMSIQSGTSVRGGNHVSKAGHSEIKSALTEAARTAIVHDSQLKDYYNRKRSEGKSHGCVMNAVKFKLICRMFAVVARQQPYINIEKYKS